MDYEKIGLKCGLEIHQQLEGKKLFCNCQTIIVPSTEKPDFKFIRKLRASASELGEVDKAALYELQKGKYFVYEGYHKSNCLTCIDEEPPLEVNKEALDISLQITLLLNAKPVSKVQFMRKIVIDGSNITSFQRTALIATDGYIETSLGKVTVPTICLEEEAAQKQEDTKEYRRYNISRLGIPLIEVATGPDIKTPEHAKESAAKIGMILRSVKGVKRGLGTIRQDVNVSIKGHPRVEIKGFQDLRAIPKVIEYEFQRQLKEKNGEAHVRKAEPDFTTSFLRPMPGSERMYVETDQPEIEITKEIIKKIKLPTLLDDKVEEYQEKYCLSPELAREIIKEEIDFESTVNEFKKLDPNLIAKILIEVPKELKSRLKVDISKLSEEHFHEVLSLIETNKVPQSASLDLLKELAEKGQLDLSNFKQVSDQELEKEIKNIIAANKGAQFGALMGMVMNKFRGKVDGKKVSELIKKNI